MSRGDSQQGSPRQGGRPIARLSAEDQARFDRLRAAHSVKVLAKRLGVGEGTVTKLEGGGYASPDVIARVVAGMVQR